METPATVFEMSNAVAVAISRLETALRSIEAGIRMVPKTQEELALKNSLKKAHHDTTFTILDLQLAHMAPAKPVREKAKATCCG